MIKAIIFDVGGVLINNPWPGMREHYVKHLQVEEEHFEKAYAEVAQDWQKGKMGEKLFWQKMCDKLQRGLPKSESLWVDGFRSTYEEKTNIFELIKLLKKKGLLIGLLSNTEVPVMHFLIEKDYPDFDVFIYSCGVGKIKPDADIYHEMLAKLQIAPGEAIFVDDKLENVEGAQKVGMIGIQFIHEDQFKAELKKYI